jgi:hypothetical protein
MKHHTKRWPYREAPNNSSPILAWGLIHSPLEPGAVDEVVLIAKDPIALNEVRWARMFCVRHLS